TTTATDPVPGPATRVATMTGTTTGSTTARPGPGRPAATTRAGTTRPATDRRGPTPPALDFAAWAATMPPAKEGGPGEGRDPARGQELRVPGGDHAGGGARTRSRQP